MAQFLRFPENFFWGTATSAHQVEGNTNNDWSEWEQSEKRLKELRSKNLDPKDFISGLACDHYNRYERDFDLALALNTNAHRFSIEWSRVEPEEGKFNEAEIEHYRKIAKALRGRGLEPFVTLWHLPFPLWLSHRGGWLAPKSDFYFARYAEKIAASLKGDVRFWLTLNEPEIYASHSYFLGYQPPQKKNIFLYVRIVNKLMEAHKAAYSAIKKIDPDAQVGLAKNNTYFEACRGIFPEALFKKFIDWWWNFRFLDVLRDHQDFIGLNYYFHVRIEGRRFNRNSTPWTNDLGWEIYPNGIYRVLKDLKKYQKPVYITENGLADAKDGSRKEFIKQHLLWIHRAIQEGVDARGYFYWSLLDNFEWTHGFAPRFGLYEMDYKTQERKRRQSALYYAEICKNNGVEI